jgi:hypothetical protein
MNLGARAKNIILTPKSEWQAIAGEPASINELMIRTAAPLAAVPAVCAFIGQSIVGVPIPLVGTTYVEVSRGVIAAVTQWALALVGVYLAALVIAALAPRFRSTDDFRQALKLVVFSSVPMWISGVLNVFPAFSLLTVLAALYGVYVCYLGMPPVLRTPNHQVMPYLALSAVATILISVTFGMATAAIVGAGAYGF